MIAKIKKLTQSIVGKIYIGYGLLILAFIINLIVSATIINTNRKKISEFSTIIDPTMTGLSKMKILEIRSLVLIQKWVKSPLYDAEKVDFSLIIDVDLPENRKKLIELSQKWKSEENKQIFNATLDLINKNIASVKEIARTLASFDDYQDPSKKFTSEDILENSVKVNFTDIEKNIDKIYVDFESLKAISEEEIKQSERNFIITIVISSILVIMFGIIFSYYIGNDIKHKLTDFKEIILNLSVGKTQGIVLKITNDEIGEMTKALEMYIASINNTSKFANQIGKGNFDNEFTKMGEFDQLGESLIAMRDNLKAVKDGELQRNWSAIGNALFAEIFQKTYINTTEICDLILLKLVKYTNANQGTIFLLRNKNDETYFEQIASYAYDRKKYANNRIELEEGLVGQCYHDNDKIYITDVPENYITIKSGLGDAAPKCILLVPIRHNNTITGVLELATFYPFKEHEVAFVEKIGENLGNTLSTIFINEKTKVLLSESQSKGEQLSAQEEEMRQNMEELMATQEEMERKSSELEVLLLEEREKYEAEITRLKNKYQTTNV